MNRSHATCSSRPLEALGLENEKLDFALRLRAEKLPLVEPHATADFPFPRRGPRPIASGRIGRDVRPSRLRRMMTSDPTSTACACWRCSAWSRFTHSLACVRRLFRRRCVFRHFGLLDHPDHFERTRGRQVFTAVFYAKRAKRILPALLLVTFTVWVFGWLSADPARFRMIGGHVKSSSLLHDQCVADASGGSSWRLFRH